MARLAQECSTRAQVVGDVVEARSVGELSDAGALEACARELHALAGIAGVLGLHAVTLLLSGLLEPIFSLHAPARTSFWDDFPLFLDGMIKCILASVEGRLESQMVEATNALRLRVVAGLTGLPEPQVAAIPAESRF